MMNNHELKMYCEAIIAQHEAYVIPAEQMPADNQALILMAQITLAVLTAPPAPIIVDHYQGADGKQHPIVALTQTVRHSARGTSTGGEIMSKAQLFEKIRSLATEAHQLACALDIGAERTEIFAVYSVLHNLTRCGYAEAACKAMNPLLSPSAAAPVALTVWYGAMPESNGKTNWTAILHRKDEPLFNGITIECSEYPDRVRYEADRMRYLIGELAERPLIINYDADKHSGYVRPASQAPAPVAWISDSGKTLILDNEIEPCFKNNGWLPLCYVSAAVPDKDGL